MAYVADLERLEGHWIGYVRGLPGCAARARTREECVAALPEAIREFGDWSGEPVDPAAEVADGEVHLPWMLDEDYEVNAFFAADRPPLSGDDVARGQRLLERTRATLLEVIGPLTAEERHREVEDGWSVNTILEHLGMAEWWYLDRLDLAPPRDALPTDVLDRLRFVRGRLTTALPDLIGSDLVTVKRMEVWSPRKILRRALWHERDHAAHTRRFVAQIHG